MFQQSIFTACSESCVHSGDGNGTKAFQSAEQTRANEKQEALGRNNSLLSFDYDSDRTENDVFINFSLPRERLYRLVT
jgi:hypothetical protein